MLVWCSEFHVARSLQSTVTLHNCMRIRFRRPSFEGDKFIIHLWILGQGFNMEGRGFHSLDYSYQSFCVLAVEVEHVGMNESAVEWLCEQECEVTQQLYNMYVSKLQFGRQQSITLALYYYISL